MVRTRPSRGALGVESYLYLDLTDDELGGRVEMPLGDLRTVFGYELDESRPDAVLDELESNRGELKTYVSDHLSVGADGRRWSYEITGIRLLEAEGGYAIVDFLADVPGKVPRELEVSFDPFFDEIDERCALLLIGNDWTGGVFDNGEEVLVGFDPSTRELRIDLGDASQWNNFESSVGLGVDHIRTGPTTSSSSSCSSCRRTWCSPPAGARSPRSVRRSGAS